jgi:hypothetical protein
MAGYEEELMRQALMAQMQEGGSQRIRPQYPEAPQELTPMPDQTGEQLAGTAAAGATGILASMIPGVGPFIAPLLAGAVGEGTKEAVSAATGSREQAQRAIEERGGDYGEERLRQIGQTGLSAGISGIQSGVTGKIRSDRIESARKIADAKEVQRFDEMEQRMMDRMPKPTRQRSPEEQAASPGVMSSIVAAADTGRSAAAAPTMQAPELAASLEEELAAGRVDPHLAGLATQIVQGLRGMA